MANSGGVWYYKPIRAKFDRVGCSKKGCRFHYSSPGDERLDREGEWQCALNLSDAIIRAHGRDSLPSASHVNYCSHGRVRNADGMARIVKKKLGPPDAVGWSSRPSWQGIVYFEGGTGLAGATGHIDLWDGTSAVHEAYPKANVVWFWKLESDPDTESLGLIYGDSVEPKSTFA